MAQLFVSCLFSGVKLFRQSHTPVTGRSFETCGAVLNFYREINKTLIDPVAVSFFTRHRQKIVKMTLSLWRLSLSWFFDVKSVHYRFCLQSFGNVSASLWFFAAS